ncbi:MAG: N-acetylneuraminate synthase family protein [Bacillota bacterium]
MVSFTLGERIIGKDAPVFIIAEAGVNHAGSFSEAKRMVDVASKCKADAVTFQHIACDEINSINIKSNYFEWDSWHLTDAQIVQLFNQAHYYGLAVTACVVDFDSLKFIVEAGADFIKIVSGDLTCHPFLAECARTGLPIFISTGSALIPEIEAALKVIEKAGCTKVVIFHTNSKYPTPPEEVDLRAIEVLKGYNYPVGFCDHTKGSAISLAAAALGARVIEKHFSLDPTVIRPDYEVSISPQQLRQFISDIRTIEKALGEPIKRRYPTKDNYVLARRSICAGKDLRKGSQLQWDDLAYKRPGTGSQPLEAENFVERTLLCNVKKGEQLFSNMLEGCSNKPVITLVVVCRLKSTRLPKKALLHIHGIPSIERCLLNCLAVPDVNHVVLATSNLPQDDPLEKFSLEGKVKVVRGDPENVAKRIVQAANFTKADIVLRVTGDNPAVSPEVLSYLIKAHLEREVDFTYPKNCAMGTGAEIITLESLNRLLNQPKPLTHTEYLSFYFINNSKMFSIYSAELPPEFQYPEWRLTLDEPKDLELFEEIYKSLNIQKEPLFFFQIREYLINNPWIIKINADVSTKWRDDPELIKEINDATVLE